jgi:tRNA-binding protein
VLFKKRKNNELNSRQLHFQKFSLALKMMNDASDLITWADFERVEIRVGTILKVSPLPNARRPAYVLEVDMGSEIGIKKSSAQLTDLYTMTDLIGKQVVAVCNFPSKQIGSIQSQILVTGFKDAGGKVVLVQPERAVPNGARLF